MTIAIVKKGFTEPPERFWQVCTRCQSLLRYEKADLTKAPGLVKIGIRCPHDGAFLEHTPKRIEEGQALARSTPAPGMWL